MTLSMTQWHEQRSTFDAQFEFMTRHDAAGDDMLHFRLKTTGKLNTSWLERV